ncbi:hypothetical protein Tco_0818010 [Tanacetum coccineum]
MDQIKAIIPEAYTYLVERNPNSWSRAFFDLNSKCASFENGIAESFNRAILVQRTKPIITMLEDIRLYIMQRLVQMKTKAMNLEDRITPSIRKRLEILKEQQRFWTVIPSGIPCVHSMAAYLFLNKEPNEGFDHWYSQKRWFEDYQFSIKPIYGSNMWKKQANKPLLLPIIVRMLGKPRKNKVKANSKNNSQVSRVVMLQTKGGGRGSRGGRGQASGGMGDVSGGRGQPSGGLGEASGALGKASNGIGQSNAVRFQANTERGESSGGRGRGTGRGGRSGRARSRGSRKLHKLHNLTPNNPKLEYCEDST